jgi:hypothetical protein
MNNYSMNSNYSLSSKERTFHSLFLPPILMRNILNTLKQNCMLKLLWHMDFIPILKLVSEQHNVILCSNVFWNLPLKMMKEVKVPKSRVLPISNPFLNNYFSANELLNYILNDIGLKGMIYN